MISRNSQSSESPIQRIETPLENDHLIEFVTSRTFVDLDQSFSSLDIPELCKIEPIHRKLREVSLDSVELGLSTYLAELHKVPLLEGDEEYEIFRWMNYLKYRATELLRGRARITRKLQQQVNCLLERSNQLRNQIVSANLRLVVSIAKKLVDRDNAIEDLISDGHLPLIRSVEIFDFERGTRFSTYATWAVRNKLFRTTPRNRKHARRFRNSTEQLFPLIPQEDDFQRSFESYHHGLQHAVEDLLAGLDDRDKHIIRARFGLNEDQKSHRFREIAEGLEISTERVRQLLARSLEKLREKSERLTIEVA